MNMGVFQIKRFILTIRDIAEKALYKVYRWCLYRSVSGSATETASVAHAYFLKAETAVG